MALVASILAAYVVISGAVTISGDIPVRREPQGSNDEPVALKETTDESVDEGEAALSLTSLHEDWPRCKQLDEHSWNTADKGAAQHLERLAVTTNVTSAQECAAICGGGQNPPNGHTSDFVPCAGWAWVAQTWATEFGGYQTCAQFGFVENEPGAVRFGVNELTFKNHCCSAGTGCTSGELLAPYTESTDLLAAAYRKAQRAVQAREPAEPAAEHYTVKHLDATATAHNLQQLMVIAIATALGLGVVAGVYTWRSGKLEA